MKKVNEVLGPERRREVNDIGPQVQTMEHLGVAFVACMIPLGLAIVVFLMEVISHATEKILLKHK